MPINTADRTAMPMDDSVADDTTIDTTAEITDVESAETDIVEADSTTDTTTAAGDTAGDDTADEAVAADDADSTDADSTDAADSADADDEEEYTGVTFGDLGLAEGIVRKLAQNGVTKPFPIQAATIPDALDGKDILGRGRTGSGKTLSFGLPLLTLLSGGHTEKKRPRGIILTPTRELAMQVADALQPYGDVLGLKMKVVCGGTSMSNQIYALERGVDILVATPGRLRDLMNRGAASLDKIQIAVLDEADQMADMGFLPEVTEILDQVPVGGQRLLFSATLENEIDSLVKRYLKNPVTHEVDAAQGAVTTMTHHVLVVKPKDKAPVTAAIAARKGRTIIFVRTQMGADRVAEQLIESGVKADALHGGMTQGARTRVLEDFKGGLVNVLVATDVAARGIHVDGIGLVLNVDPAADHKDYLHRSGRTARAGESGTVVSLALPHQRKTIFRLMEDAGVDASRHIIGGSGVFDEEVAMITGARSMTDVQADSVQNAAAQAERDVADMTRELEKLQRRATELREEADRLTMRSARERGEDPEEAVAAKALEIAEAAAAEAARIAAIPVQPEPRRDRDERGNYGRRDDRPSSGGYGGGRDRRDERPSGGRSFERRDERPSSGGGFRSGGDRPTGGRSFERRDERPSSGGGFRSGGDRPTGGRSFERRDDRPSSGGFNRDRRDERPSGGRSFERRDERPSSGGGFRSGGDRPTGDRPTGGRSFERRDERPATGGFRSGGDRPATGGFNRDRREERPATGGGFRTGGDRPFNRDRRDDRPAGRTFERRDSRPGNTGTGSIDRKPRWKAN
ncbi:DEAD/DEAH box helicase [Streptomyces sp. H10-C2]|uniref:DEAD/DEAH box helicase n=1 Tax=unclassified Streptomyces TaxID=2593676 RepID=UPI0024B9725D|nr:MULTISPECIES: DEAD/DEAH box helicase [unclassified Streptomyces]MDJ0344977.1 DEAD/DEAH box helicase [Streptomyces sp. PH10-H1]MDJ0373942.1 DEAD/DEAH box helicase [Streptomyces sp. H10-C2]